MKRIAFSIVFLFASLALMAQGTASGFNVKDFDTVRFVFHYYSPTMLDESQVRIVEDGVSLKDSVKIEPQNVQSTAMQKRNVLFLWDLRSSIFISELLSDYFLKTQTNDSLMVDVVAFGRNEKDELFVESLMRNSFSKDLSAAEEAVRNFPIRWYGEFEDWTIWSYTSDILLTLDKAIKYLESLPVDEAKAIVLFTDGRNNPNTGTETLPLVSAAKKGRIQIYCVNIMGDEAGKHLCETLSSRTFGQCLMLDDIQESQNGYSFVANETISSWIDNLPQQWNGITYDVAYKSNAKLGQKTPVNVEIHVDDDTITALYSVPNKTLWRWAKTHLVLFLILLFVAMAVLGTGVFFLVPNLRDVAADKKEEAQRLEAERSRLKSEQEALSRRMEIAENERRRKQEQEEAKEKAAQRREHLSSINALMASRNIKARVLVSSMKGNDEFSVGTAENTVGRAKDNDIVIDDPTVSQHHAVLYFDGEHFHIRDLHSTNGVVMNGYRVEDLELRNGDVFSLGNVILKINI